MGVVVLMCVLAVFPIAFGEDVKSSESSITVRRFTRCFIGSVYVNAYFRNSRKS